MTDNIAVEHRRLASDPSGATFAYSWEEFLALCYREGLTPPWNEISTHQPCDFDGLARWLAEQSGGLLQAYLR